MSKSAIALAVVGALGGAASADAATLPVNLLDVTVVSVRGTGSAILSLSSATWSYDTVTGVVTGSGEHVAQFQLNPAEPGQLFTHNVFDMVIGGGGAAAATSYVCIEGSFGAEVNGHQCGNYTFGSNGINESMVSYGPGTAFSRTIGGDDVVQGPQQNLELQYSGMVTTFFDSNTLVVSNADPYGFTMTFQVVPVPAAAWLFGSALGLLSWTRIWFS